MQWIEGSDFLGSNISSQRGRTESSTDLTNLPSAPQSNVAEFLEGSIREYINNESGIIEVSNRSDVSSYTTVFFHASVVYIADPTGNPYGHPVRLPCGISLEEAMDIGTGVHISVLPVASRWVKYQATAVWPSIARAPISSAVEMPIDNSVYMKNFHSKVNPNMVTATIHGLTGSAEAIVAEVKDYEYGIIQIQFNKEDRLFSLFHRDDVYLPDGKRAVAHQYFKDKPLDMIVTVGQEVNLIARSIVSSKGYDLLPSGTTQPEVQAIVVSLNPREIPKTAPRGSSCSGGHGTYRRSYSSSFYFFNEELRVKLNQRLITFLERLDIKIPNIDKQCLNINDHDSNSSNCATVGLVDLAASSTNVHTKPLKMELQSFDTDSPNLMILNKLAVVKEVLSEDSAILENREESWMCFFTLSNVLPRGPVSNLGEALPPGTLVGLNATLIDDRKRIKYLATSVWNNKTSHLVPRHELNEEIDNELLRKYFDVNEIFEQNDRTPKRREGICESIAFPEIYESKEGMIFRLLDDNFGILRVEDNLVLFDTCDFWIDTSTTASRRGLKLGQVVGLGSTVVFHACRLEEKTARVQYLASAVWKMELHDQEFKISTKLQPKPITVQEIVPEKIAIFKQVVATVSPSLPVFSGRKPAIHVLNGKLGVVETTFIDEKGISICGVMNVSGLGSAGQEKMRCAFISEHCNGLSVPKEGCSCRVNIRRVVRKYSWSDKVPYVALTVYPMYCSVKEEEQEKAGEKEEVALRKFDEIYGLVARSNRGCPLVEPVKKVYQIRSRSKFSPIVAPIEDREANTVADKTSIGRFKCLTSRTTGIMQDIQDPSILIYFELADLIGKEKKYIKAVSTYDVVKLMCNMAGVKVCYKASKMKSQNIQYAAHQNGLWLNIAGGKRLARHLEFLQNVRLEKKQLKKTADLPDRMRRFKEAECNFKFSNRLRTIEQVRKEEETEKKQELIAVKGTVRVILNENFGLLWGPIEESDAHEIQYYCLFDTYDLLVSGKQSAADKGMTMSSVVRLGDELIYNACLMDKRKIVPYLATSVWNGVDRAFDVPPMAKANIQSDKVNVYSQVVLSCMPFIEKREREEYAEENEKVEKTEKRAREEEIKNKAQVLCRKEQEEKIRNKAQVLRRKEQEEEIRSKAQVIRRKEQEEKERRGDLKNVHTKGTLQELKIVPYDLVDWRTKGAIEIEKCDLFAILRLWNNEHVLLSTHR